MAARPAWNAGGRSAAAVRVRPSPPRTIAPWRATWPEASTRLKREGTPIRVGFDSSALRPQPPRKVLWHGSQAGLESRWPRSGSGSTPSPSAPRQPPSGKEIEVRVVLTRGCYPCLPPW